MDISAIANAIETGLAFVEKLAPYAAEAGVPFATAVGKAAGAVSEIIENVQTRIEEGTLVAKSADVAYINKMADQLFAINVQLNEYVKAS